MLDKVVLGTFLLTLMNLPVSGGELTKVFDDPSKMYNLGLYEPISLKFEEGPILNLYKRNTDDVRKIIGPGEKGSIFVDGDNLLVRFWALGRPFECLATRKASVISGDVLQVTVMEHDGSTDYHFTEKQLNHFEGHLLDDASSACYGFPEKDGRLSLIIESLTDGHFFVEPMDYFFDKINSSTSPNNVVYRGNITYSHYELEHTRNTDINAYDWNRFRRQAGGNKNKSAKKNKAANKNKPASPKTATQRPVINYGEYEVDSDKLTEEIKLRRLKKLNGSHITIRVFLHSSLYELMNKSMPTAVNKLVATYTYMDRLFRLFDFNRDGTADNLGARLVNITIMTTPTDGLLGRNIDNVKYGQMFQAGAMLRLLEDLKYAFPKKFAPRVSVEHFLVKNLNLAGLAYINCCCDKTGNVAVIKGMDGTSNKLKSTPNFAFLLMHETNHLMNCVDVYEGDACAPKKQLPYHPDFGLSYSNLSRFKALNFTNCNNDRLYEWVAKKGPFDNCYVPDNQRASTCGNLIVEKDEECDSTLLNDTRGPLSGMVLCCAPPLTGIQKSSYVLDKPCHLTRNAYGSACDPTHSPCCNSNCKIASVSEKKICLPQTKPCQLTSLCDGLSPKCPIAQPAKDGSPCKKGKGVCRGGECVVKPVKPLVPPVVPVVPPVVSTKTRPIDKLPKPTTLKPQKPPIEPAVPTIQTVLPPVVSVMPPVVPTKTRPIDKLPEPTTLKPQKPPIEPAVPTIQTVLPSVVPVMPPVVPVIPPVVSTKTNFTRPVGKPPKQTTVNRKKTDIVSSLKTSTLKKFQWSTNAHSSSSRPTDTKAKRKHRTNSFIDPTHWTTPLFALLIIFIILSMLAGFYSMFK